MYSKISEGYKNIYLDIKKNIKYFFLTFCNILLNVSK